MSPVLHVCSCGAIVERKPCAKCKRADNQRRSRKNREQGKHTKAWQDIRHSVLVRDNYQCVRCHSRWVPLSVHRIDGAYHDNDLTKYETLCTSCHGAVDGPRASG